MSVLKMIECGHGGVWGTGPQYAEVKVKLPSPRTDPLLLHLSPGCGCVSSLTVCCCTRAVMNSTSAFPLSRWFSLSCWTSGLPGALPRCFPFSAFLPVCTPLSPCVCLDYLARIVGKLLTTGPEFVPALAVISAISGDVLQQLFLSSYVCI